MVMIVIVLVGMRSICGNTIFTDDLTVVMVMVVVMGVRMVAMTFPMPGFLS
jgi:hypothetical protein